MQPQSYRPTRLFLLLRLTQRHLSTAAAASPHRTLSMASAAGSEPGLADIAASRCGTAASAGVLGPMGEINRSLDENNALANARWVQLATVRADGRPAVRTVVFRGFMEGSALPAGSLMFTTDTRSEKCEQITASNAAELCTSQFSLRAHVCWSAGALTFFCRLAISRNARAVPYPRRAAVGHGCFLRRCKRHI